MRLWILAAIGTAFGLGGVELKTDYGRERALEVEITSSVETETTAFRMEFDGEPTEREFGGMTTRSEHTITFVDRVLAHAEGAPTKVQRRFDQAEAERTTEFGDEADSSSDESPIVGVTLELTLAENGDVAVEVVDGDEPEGVELEGFGLALALDSLAPEGAVEAGESWEISSETARQVLGFGLERQLFPRPEREGGFGRGDGEGGRGGRGRGFGGRGASTRFLSDIEWNGKATLESIEGDGDERRAIVAITLNAEGDLPEPDFGGEEDGRRGIAAGLVPLVDNTYEIELEGELVWHLGEARPISFEIEGEMKLETYRERETQRGVMTTESTVEGRFHRSVTVSEEGEDE